jgi:hypothetical protein
MSLDTNLVCVVSTRIRALQLSMSVPTFSSSRYAHLNNLFLSGVSIPYVSSTGSPVADASSGSEGRLRVLLSTSSGCFSVTEPILYSVRRIANES